MGLAICEGFAEAMGGTIRVGPTLRGMLGLFSASVMPASRIPQKAFRPAQDASRSLDDIGCHAHSAFRPLCDTLCSVDFHPELTRAGVWLSLRCDPSSVRGAAGGNRGIHMGLLKAIQTQRLRHGLVSREVRPTHRPLPQHRQEAFAGRDS